MLLFDRIQSLLDRDALEGDVALYSSVLLYGEFVFKLVVLCLTAGVQVEKTGAKYRQLYNLVRANSLGDWVRVVDEVLTGPTAAHLESAARGMAREWTQPADEKSWQVQSVKLLTQALDVIEPGGEPIPGNVQGRRWLSTFAQYRNASIRGHGVERPAHMSRAVPLLRRSIDLIARNCGVFSLEFAHLRRNLSGKYRITPISATVSAFSHLRSTTRETLPDGAYVAFDEKTLKRVELLDFDSDTTDFFVPNGAFTSQKYQTVSYITGQKREVSAGDYLRPAGELPSSSTEGLADLDVVGNVFSNVPVPQGEYVRRPAYERALEKVLLEEIHPIATLVGRGGIGKTSMALQVLHRVATNAAGRYFAIVWFSARDIDLLDSGPKVVRPGAITEVDVARDLVRYLGLSEGAQKKTDAVKRLAEYLNDSPPGPLLFVFDNFETFVNPAEFYSFIDTHLRPPNKVLITSRERRYFKGDYPIEVGGMEYDECNKLIDIAAEQYGVSSKITEDFRTAAIDESGGHPYIMRVLVGEVARRGAVGKVERILATEDAMLSALFERTYSSLSPAAKKIFLLLSSWRSRVYRLAAEAVLLRADNERVDVAAIDELIVSSLIEQPRFGELGFETLSVPVVAQLFGRQKLRLSTERFSIERDSKYLQSFGAMQIAGSLDDLEARLKRVAAMAAESNDDAYLEIIEFCASKIPSAWLLLASLFEERGDDAKAISAIERLLERPVEPALKIAGWRKRRAWAVRQHDTIGELFAWSELASIPDVPFVDVSSAANRANGLYASSDNTLAIDEKRNLIRGLVRAMESRMSEADGLDWSRLAWLYVHLGERQSAIRAASDGLHVDQQNIHCRRLLDRMGVKFFEPQLEIDGL